MTRLIVLIVLTAVAVGVAYQLQRRRPEPPSAPSYKAPTQVDRMDFAGATEPILIAMFSSTTCNSCAAAWDVIEAEQRPGVAIERIDVQSDPERHKRYKIDGVPTTIVVSSDGVVQERWFGPMSNNALDGALPPRRS